ncbi:MAG: hypothetical protein J6Q13_02630 [Clostridia bacterium]|nr:hypothetical protein [Clostridia bacterium]
MKKTVLQKLLYQHMNSYEIVNVGYDGISSKFELLLRKFEYIDDKIKYLNSFKKIVFLDKYAFRYYEDGVLYNTFDEQINRIVLEDELLCFKNFSFSKLQKDWINILKNLGEFNEEEFNDFIVKEIKQQMNNAI